MVVKSFLLTLDNISAVSQLCCEGTIAVIRPEKKIEDLFRAAVRKSIMEKKSPEEEFKDIKLYFSSLDTDAGYLSRVADTLHSVSAYLGEGMYVQASPSSIEDYVLAKCARLCAEAVSVRTGGTFIDGTILVYCREDDGRSLIDWTLSRSQVAERCSGLENIVVSGGYGRLESGYIVRVGRGGSHVMASLIASAVHAEKIECYTSGDGIRGIAAMTYDEAAHYCASADAPFPSASLWPAKQAGIPVVVKNIDNPSFGGTIISSAGADEDGRKVSGIICDRGLALITVYGTGLLGQIGMSSAIFSALAAIGVNIKFISQSSSEYSISLAVNSADREKSVQAINRLVVGDTALPLDDVMVLEKSVGIVTVYGDRMKNVPGVSGKVYSAIGDASINIIASAQGGEELSISLVLDEADLPKALTALSF